MSKKFQKNKRERSNYKSFIRESFDFISFSSIPLGCNRATLTLASATKEEEEAIVWLKECLFFLFSIVQCDLH